MSDQRIDYNKALKDSKTCYQIILVGLIIMWGAFLLAGVNYLTEDPIIFVERMHIPLTFAGLGTLVFGLGRHLHLLHINILRMDQMKKQEQNHQPS